MTAELDQLHAEFACLRKLIGILPIYIQGVLVVTQPLALLNPINLFVILNPFWYVHHFGDSAHTYTQVTICKVGKGVPLATCSSKC